VRRILIVLPNWAPSAAAEQTLLAAKGLPAGRFEVHVAGFGGENLAAAKLRAAGVRLHPLGPRRLLDLNAVRSLHDLTTRLRPQVTLAWKPAALWPAALLPRSLTGRLLAADVLPERANDWTRAHQRWALGRVKHILVSGDAERNAAVRLGIPLERLTVLRPGFAQSGETAHPWNQAGGRFILAIGPLERARGLYEAVWCLEILQYLYADLRLVIVGAGPDGDRLRAFVRDLGADAMVHFLGARTDLAPLYAGATIVWIPSHADRGAYTALEAMNAGKPVVASHWPMLAEAIEPGVTGLLVPAGDKVALAKQTRKLLDDTSLAQKIGQAGQEYVRSEYSSEAYLKAMTELFDS
jgi:glycosyltransferase involved in cell wall biosynthesis